MDNDFTKNMAADFSENLAAYTLRPARLEDLDQLAVIDAACFPPGIAYPRKYLQDIISAPTSVTRVALPVAKSAEQIGPDAASIVGFAVLEIRRRVLTVVGELVTIDVLASARRNGVGRLLYASLERAVRHRKGRRIRLQVSVENEPAIRFYEQLGYRTRGRIPRYYMGKIDAWWMEKILE